MTSQHGQDAYVLAALGHRRAGYFLDSGASNGVRSSNTRLLEQEYGWTGICVEPNPHYYAELTANRRCFSVNCCLYDHDGTVEFVEAGTIGGILGEYSPQMLTHVRRALELPDDAPMPVTVVPCRTVGSLLRQFGAPRVIDYWSLDTEGSELAILRTFPFGRYLLRMLTVEHNWGPDRRPVHDLLARHGFVRVAELGCDDVYAHRSVVSRGGAWRSQALSARGRGRPS
ncbi:FkbM family methyltransferase [Microbispora amethystogenes]|uniref:FkbM family methyltransferase n=1 Tax=Microbispora amethystogenes TaxID=1427754 RepID=UPI001952ECED|nr:FkbM family methyltransferase [Microbispora amethystogenes]